MALFKRQSGPPARGRKNYNRAPVTTYYQSKAADNQASPFKKKQPRRSGHKILFGAADIILIILVLSGLIYSLMLNAKPKLEVSDLSYRKAGEYQAGIDPLFGSLKNRNKLSFDQAGLIKQIQKKYPEIQSVQVELPFFSQQPKVWLNISKPAFKLSSSGSSYIVDSAGLAVAKSQSLPQLKNLLVLNDQSGYSAGLGKQILASQAVDFINSVITQAKRAKVPVSSLTLPPAAQELDLRTSDAPYYVKFYLGGDALTQSGQFLAARQKFAQSAPPAEYLDVRVSGKIFYK